MNAEEDARATWKLLSPAERRVLRALDTPHVVTPADLARSVVVSRQRARHLASQMKELGLVIIHRRPKQTDYELSGQGRACLQAGSRDPEVSP